MTRTPMTTVLSALLETGLNRLLSLDPTSQERSKPLHGKVLKLELHGIPAIWFVFSSLQVDVLSVYEHPAHASINLKWQGLEVLQHPENLSRYIREERLDLQGDPALFHAFSHLLSQLNIDWEEHLSSYTGDVLAHWLFRGAKKIRKTASLQWQLTQQDLREAMTEEWQLAPSPLQLVAFYDDVGELAHDSEQLLQRAEQLLKRSAQ
jgi:ubiquinone biosynthesis accessory factor UbiJ